MDTSELESSGGSADAHAATRASADKAAADVMMTAAASALKPTGCWRVMSIEDVCDALELQGDDTGQVTVMTSGKGFDDVKCAVVDVLMPTRQLVAVCDTQIRRAYGANDHLHHDYCFACRRFLGAIHRRNDQLYLCDLCTRGYCDRCLDRANFPVQMDVDHHDPKTQLLSPGAPVDVRLSAGQPWIPGAVVMDGWHFGKAPPDVVDNILRQHVGHGFIGQDEVYRVQVRPDKSGGSRAAAAAAAHGLDVRLVSIQGGTVRDAWEPWRCIVCERESDLEDMAAMVLQRALKESATGVPACNLAGRGPYLSRDASTDLSLSELVQVRLCERKLPRGDGTWTNLSEVASGWMARRSATQAQNAQVPCTPPYLVLVAGAAAAGGACVEGLLRAGVNVQAAYFVDDDWNTQETLKGRYQHWCVGRRRSLREFEGVFFEQMKAFEDRANAHFARLPLRRRDAATGQLVPYEVDEARVVYIGCPDMKDLDLCSPAPKGMASAGGRAWSSVCIIKRRMLDMYPGATCILEARANVNDDVKRDLVSMAGHDMVEVSLNGGDFGIAMSSKLFFINQPVADLLPYQWSAFVPEDFAQRSSHGAHARCTLAKAPDVGVKHRGSCATNRILNMPAVEGMANHGRAGSVTRPLTLEETCAAHALPTTFVEALPHNRRASVIAQSSSAGVYAHLMSCVMASEGMPTQDCLSVPAGTAPESAWWATHGVTTDQLHMRRKAALCSAVAELPLEDIAADPALEAAVQSALGRRVSLRNRAPVAGV